MGNHENENPLNDLIQQAVKIKGAQSQQLRRVFDSYPEYLQNTLFVTEREEEEIELKALEYKKTAASFIQEKDYLSAYKEYEKAIGLFKYIINTDKDWKSKGIIDEHLEVIEKPPDHVELQISLYNNIALCLFHLKKYTQAIYACNDTLALDNQNSKALYRRALSRITPASSGALEQELALKDLKTALIHDVNNKDVRRQLLILKQARDKQRVRDKSTFSGMFERGQVVTTEYAKNNDTVSKEASRYRKIKEATIAIKLLRESGDYEKAREIEEQLRRLKTNEPVDFLNPTPEMIRDAMEHSGIDLTDKKVQQYCHQLATEKNKTTRRYYFLLIIPIIVLYYIISSR